MPESVGNCFCVDFTLPRVRSSGDDNVDAHLRISDAPL